MRQGGIGQYALMTLAGLLLRAPLGGWFTHDYILYLLPWYQFARAHGWNALAVDFTNYSPFFSYLLIVATRFDALAPPLVLLKAISFVFEFANAVVGAVLVATCGGDRRRQVAAFGCVFIAPTVLYNGAAWAQTDSIWTFFVLVSIWLFARGRNGTPAFGMAFAVKAQALFLGPFVLGMLVRGGVARAAWLAVVPVVYLLVAVPVFVAGRSVADVAFVYGRQAEFFHSLSMNAASLWALPPRLPYTAGSIAGLGMAVVAALWLARAIKLSPRRDATFALLAAAASLLLMPFILPKMHDRYFYAFEVTAIVLACVDRRYIAFAVIAQVDGVLSYLGFDQGIMLGIRLAAIGNAAMVYFLLRDVVRAPGTTAFPGVAWAGYAAVIGATALFLPWTMHGLPGLIWKGAYAALIVATAAAVLLLLRRSLGTTGPPIGT